MLAFSQFLHGQGIPHRINEESGQQVIWVEDEATASIVAQALSRWSDTHDTHADNSIAGSSAQSLSSAGLEKYLAVILRQFLLSPVTFSLFAFCLLVAAISSLGRFPDRVEWLFFPLIDSGSLLGLLADIRSPVIFLKTLTPMFLHFGELHLVFNMLWLWYFGKQLEALQPRWQFVVLILVTSFASNTLQYLYTGYNNFGGMSGVVYGLVGFTWIVHSMMPVSRLMIRNSMFGFFVVALVLMELFAGSWIASAAHVGGLISGLLLGLATVLYYRLILKQDAIHK